MPRLLFFSFSTVDPPLHFVRDLFAEQTRGLHAKHHDQDGEGKGIGKDAPIRAFDDALADTDEKRPHHGAGNGADTAEYRRYEGPQSRQGAGQGDDGQRDLFGNLRCTICLGSRQTDFMETVLSMRQAMWFCQDRLCHPQTWRDAETEQPEFRQRYMMEAAQKKRFQVAAECLDTARFAQELEQSFQTVMSQPGLNGQMFEDGFDQVLAACLYGMQQDGQAAEGFVIRMRNRFWLCPDAKSVFQVLKQDISRELQRLGEERSLREMRPITEAKRYIQQHYQESLRLEDVSSAVGFNATYFSTLFKKETGQNFLDYLTELRISKAKELLCGETLSVQDVAETVGYSDLKYFSRLFKKATGVSPSDYKKLYK